MKKAITSSLFFSLLLVSGLFILNFSAYSQESSKESPALPDNVNKIVTASCISCHSSNGRFLARLKLNFTNWRQYSVETQKVKASKMSAMLNKGAMPPKSEREIHPEKIPTREQIDIIKKWSESFDTGAIK